MNHMHNVVFKNRLGEFEEFRSKIKTIKAMGLAKSQRGINPERLIFSDRMLQIYCLLNINWTPVNIGRKEILIPFLSK